LGAFPLVTASARAKFDPSGQRIAVAQHAEVDIKDVSTGQSLLKAPLRHPPGMKVCSLDFSPDGKLLAAGGFDDRSSITGRLLIYNLETGQPLVAFPQSPMILSLAFSPDGKRLATGSIPSAPKTIQIRDCVTGALILEFSRDTIYRLAYSPDGKYVVAAGSAGVKFWDAETGVDVPVLKPSEKLHHIYGLAFSHDGTRLATSYGNRTGSETRPPGRIQVWDVASGEEEISIEGRSIQVFSLAFSADDKRLISAGGEWNGTIDSDRSIDDTRPRTTDQPADVTVWDLKTAKAVYMLRGHAGAIYSIAVSPDGSRIASGGQSVRVWSSGGVLPPPVDAVKPIVIPLTNENE